MRGKRQGLPSRTPGDPPRTPGFSVRYMDRSIRPQQDFYRYSVGRWLDRNPVPPDKSRWGAFEELNEFNYDRIRRLLEGASRPRGRVPDPVAREAGDFYAAALDVRGRNRRGFRPIEPILAQIQSVGSPSQLIEVLSQFHSQGIPALFGTNVYPDKKNSDTYGFYIVQGGLSLPDRAYYLVPGFAPQRRAFRSHLIRMFRMLGDSASRARRETATIVAIETELAKSSRTRTELRDEERNYHRTTVRAIQNQYPAFEWERYLQRRGAPKLRRVIVGQPEFLASVHRLLRRRSLQDWKTYLRWHLLLAAAPFLHEPVEREYFRFFHATLLGQKKPEPMWKRAARTADRAIGDALGQLYVRKHFPPATADRMRRLVRDLRGVFRDRLEQMAWMTPTTRLRALRKFRRFTTKIGHPRHFRDDSKLRIDPHDYLGNIRRANEFELRRKIRRVGRRVDRDEWRMTPSMVNAYFDPTQNEIVFPAGILQPPFFDPKMDDAVNYGGIGLVIGHEITHGYDDQGRRYDERGNLRDWWTSRDAREFRRRANKVIAQYNGFEALPGAFVNGALTVGENIADLGGLSIAFEALQRRLRKNPAQRRNRDGLTPEQRFFISYAQIWRETVRPADERRLLTVDEHSPGRFRVRGAVTNSRAFFEAFGIHEGDRMWRPETARTRIW